MGKNKKNRGGGTGIEGKVVGGTDETAIAGLLFGMLFGLCFAAMGAWVGLRPMSQMLYAAWEVRSWQATPVEVLEAGLEARDDGEGSTVYAVHARYRYVFAGQTHESSRIGLDRGIGADNLGLWHHQWSERLQAARDGGPRLLAWVDPARPERAVLDRQIRWSLLLLLTPFALLFPLVGLGVLAGCWQALRAMGPAGRRRTGAAGPREPVASLGLNPLVAQLKPRHRLLFLWFVAIFWCGLAFPGAALFIDSGAPIWVRLFCSVFVLVGLALGWEAARQTWLAWRYGRSRLHIRPARPRAGQRLELELQLSARAAAAWRRARPPHWCLSQYRVDESSSGSPEREVQRFEQPARMQDLGPAGLRLQASFEIPADAAPDGSQRSGERVDWRLSLRTAGGRIMVDYGVPVQGAEPAVGVGVGRRNGQDDSPASGPHAQPLDDQPLASQPLAGQPLAARRESPAALTPDPFARRTGPARDEAIPAQPVDERPPVLPDGVRWTENGDASLLEFRQKGWRRAGLLVLLLLGGLVFAGRGDELSLPALLGQSFLLALGVHGLTRRRTLQVRDDGLRIERQSWVWTRRTSMPASALDQLFHRLHHVQQYPGWQQEFHALYSRWPGRARSTRLTPALPGRQGAETLAHFLRWAGAQRRGRFSPGARREEAAPSRSRPGWGLGLGLCLGLLLLWLLQRP